MLAAVSIILLSVSIVAVAVMCAVLTRRLGGLADEVTEMQALCDLLLLDHGRPPVFAERYGVEIEEIDET